MPQLFHPSMNTLSKVSLVFGIALVAGIVFAAERLYRSSFVTDVNVPREQPVPFSHQHHVGGLGIDCRFCHDSVEESAFAGIPSSETCMTCHSQIWSDSPLLEQVRESYRTGLPLQWVRVNDLPGFVYFDHSIHVRKGVGCATCHGRVDRMPLTWKAGNLFMSWCLDCHRAPEKYIRPREEVFNMAWEPPRDRPGLGRELLKTYDVRVEQLADCSICHR